MKKNIQLLAIIITLFAIPAKSPAYDPITAKPENKPKSVEYKTVISQLIQYSIR